MSLHPADNTPADVVYGVDERFTLTPITIPGAQCTCEYKGTAEEMEQHLAIAHPAVRNPEQTCQEPAPWDDQRWCARARNHPAGEGNGGHWTPTYTGGGKFW